jgi:CubicO group peptidase (beta-lactamase class C family)
MEQIVRASVESGDFTGSVLVARGGEVLLDRGYGMANREWSAPNDGDTKFRLASVSKQFTAVSLMILKDRGLVDLDAPIKTYLSDAPATWDAVTVRGLLAHTAGIPDFTRFDSYEALKRQPATVKDLVALFRDRPLDFQPDERWAYSNSGYVLATAVIEAVSGEPYAEFVIKTLFQPLGMSDSGYDSHAAILTHRASGYVPSSDGVRNADYIDMSVPQGAGGLYSTPRDLLKWEQGLFGGRLLTPQSLALLTTPQRSDYALGLMVKTEGDDTIVSHSGGIEGFNTYMGRDVDREMTVIVLGNLNGGAPDKIGASLMTLARGGTVVLPSERVAITLSPDVLQTYEGVYALALTATLTVKAENGKLTGQMTGQGAFELFAEKPDAFFLRVVDAQITFTRDAAGAIDGLVLHQGGRDMPAKRN